MRARMSTRYRGWALGAALLTALAAGAAEDITPAEEIAEALGRGVGIRPKVDQGGYTTPETSAYVSLQSVQFALNSDELTPRAKAQLDEVASGLATALTRAVVVKPAPSAAGNGASAQAEPGSAGNSASTSTAAQVIIDGHTCDLGSDAHNRELSERRARAVRDYLVSRGVSGAILRTRGFGRTRPVVPNTGESQRARNRRVDFVLQRHQSVGAGTRGVAFDTTAEKGLLETEFRAVADSRGGREYVGAEIDDLTEGDQFLARIRVLQGCHVYAALLDSKAEVTWLRLDAPDNGWALPADAGGEHGVWCYFGAVHWLPSEGRAYRLDANPGREVLCVLAGPAPLPDATALEGLLRQHGGELTAAQAQAALGVQGVELHILTFTHR